MQHSHTLHLTLRQFDTINLPLAAGMYTPEHLFVQGLVMTVIIPAAMCIAVAEIRTHNLTPAFVSTTRASVAQLLYPHNNNALHQHGAEQPKLFAHPICHQLNTTHKYLVTITTRLCIITVSTTCTFYMM